VNGWSGYSTNLQQWLGSDGSPFTELDEIRNGIDMMRGLGVRYVIVHAQDFVPRDAGPRTLEALRRARDKWIDMRQFGEAYAFVLPPASPAALPRVERVDSAIIHVRASDRSDLISTLFDDRPMTTWTTGKPQRGSEWLELAFDRALDVRRIRFETDPSVFSDYPRAIVVDALDRAGAVRLFEGPVGVEFGRGFLEDPVRPAIDLLLPAHSTNKILIRQTGSSEWWWSIGELSVWNGARDSGGTPK
jgi:hypothetical protein